MSIEEIIHKETEKAKDFNLLDKFSKNKDEDSINNNDRDNNKIEDDKPNHKKIGGNILEKAFSENNIFLSLKLEEINKTLSLILDTFFDKNKDSKLLEGKDPELEKEKAINNFEKSEFDNTVTSPNLLNNMETMEAQTENGVILEKNPAIAVAEVNEREKELEKVDRLSVDNAERTLKEKGSVNQSTLGTTDIASQHDASSSTQVELNGLS